MKFLEKILKLVMILSTAILAVVTFYQVIMRFIFSSPVPWGQDIIRLSFIYSSLLGGAYCLKKGDHLNIDVIFDLLSERAGKYLKIGINIVLMFFFFALFYYGILFTMTGKTQQAPYLSIPMTVYYAAIPITALYLMIYNFEIILNGFKDLKEEKQ